MNRKSLKYMTPTPLLYKYRLQKKIPKFEWFSDWQNKTAFDHNGEGASPSAVQNRLDNCNAYKERFSCQSFVVIDPRQADFHITINEAQQIKSNRPWLNKQLHSLGSSFVLNIFWSLWSKLCINLYSHWVDNLYNLSFLISLKSTCTLQ